MMYFRPDLVKTANLSRDKDTWPLGIMGEDPGTNSGRKYGKAIVDYEIKKMASLIRKELNN